MLDRLELSCSSKKRRGMGLAETQKAEGTKERKEDLTGAD